MKNIFTALANPITERLRYKNEVRREFDLIRGDKVATLLDLSECFFDADKPRGYLGMDYYESAPAIFEVINVLAAVGEIPLFNLPVNLAHSKTVEAIDMGMKRAEATAQKEEAEFRKFFKEQSGAELNLMVMRLARPERLEALYLGDFIDIATMLNGFAHNLNRASYFGDGANALSTVKDLRNIPDYSSHFPPRPPRNGQGKKSTEPDRPVPVGALNPV